MSGCRIGKVKFKSGCELRVLPPALREDPLISGARALVESAANAGYVRDSHCIVAWNRDAPHSASVRIVSVDSPDNRVPYGLIADFVHNQITRYQALQDVDHVLNDFGLVDIQFDAPDPAA